MTRTTLLFVAVGLAACSAPAVVPQAPDNAAAIETPKRPVTDVFHGVEVSEDYRWLENANDPEVIAWSDQQNVAARRTLDELPSLAAIRARLTEIAKAPSTSTWSLSIRDERVFAVVRDPQKQHPFLVVMGADLDPKGARVLFDPGAYDSEGVTAMDWYAASPDGKLVAVSLSKRGTESGDVHLFDVQTGKKVHETIPRVNGGTAGGDLEWAPDGSGFYYTRYPRGTERAAEDMNFFQQLYFHKLGTPTSEDRYELGKGLPRIAEIDLTLHQPSGRLLATVQNGDGGEFELHLRGTDGSWRKFSEFGDKVIQAAFGPNDDLVVLSRAGAPRGKLLRVSGKTLDLAGAALLLDEGDDTIVDSFWGSPTVLVTKTRIFVVFQTGGPSEIRVFDHQGQYKASPKLPPVSTAAGMTPLADDKILYYTTSYLDPGAWLEYDAGADATTKTPLVTEAAADFSDVEVVREFATSKDGTKVPVNILVPEGVVLDGTNPCVVTGYGGYGVNITPRYRASNDIYLSNGVIVAVANIRGGGEYGERWHREGNLTKKQNVFDDFAAVLRHMISRGYTSSARLAITGGSNGGLLMGATFVQNPGLARVVASSVGIYDMLRVELSPNGAFNVTEFGTVKDPDHFKALYAYSPYHNVLDGVAYPAILFTTGKNDPRVDPMQSRKMTARLQAASSSGEPILLRTNNSGHGGSTPLDERIAKGAHQAAYILHNLGVTFR